jgi:hypothetical protein
MGLDAEANARSAAQGKKEKKSARKRVHGSGGANKCSSTPKGYVATQNLGTQCVDDDSTLAYEICLLALVSADYEEPKKKPRPPSSTDVVATDGSSSNDEEGAVEDVRPSPSTDVVVTHGSSSSGRSNSGGEGVQPKATVAVTVVLD